MSAHLIVTMGAPGSGKSTYAKGYRHVVTTDALQGTRGSQALINRVFKGAFRTVEFLLSTKREVVFDTTANHPAIREQAIRAARMAGARTTLVIFDPDIEQCLAAQRARENPIPEDVVRNIHASIRDQIEDVAHEGWNEVIVRREGGAQ